MKSPRFNIWFWLIVALLLRLYKLSQVYCIASDGTAYINIARFILVGKWFHPIWPPLYPWFTSWLLRWGLSPELSGGLISVFFGVLTVALVYFVSREITSLQLAQAATVFAVFHPFLVRYSAEVLSDSLFTCILILVVFLGWQAVAKKSLLLSCAVGAVTALAYLTKPEGVMLLVIITGWWLAAKKGESINCRIIHIVCSWLVFLLISFPYLCGLYETSGQWMISQKQNLVFGIQLQEEGYTQGVEDIAPWEYLLKEPGKFFNKVGNDFLVLLGRLPDAYHPLLFILLLVGLFSNWGRQEKRYLRYIFSFIIIYFIGYAIYHPGRRYLISWVPLTLFLAAAGWQRITNWLDQRLSLRTETLFLAVIILVLLPAALAPVRFSGRQWKQAGLWLKQNSTPGMRVMGPDERIAFYADRQHVPWGRGRGDFIVSRENIPGLKLLYYTESGFRVYDRGETNREPACPVAKRLGACPAFLPDGPLRSTEG